MLNPTDNTNFSVKSILFNFSICRINNPGKRVRKRNPRICLRNGMFRIIVISVRRSIAIINKKHSLGPKFLVAIRFKLEMKSLYIFFRNVDDNEFPH
jgi:hypothetical protein